MTQSAVTAHIHSFRPQPSARAQGVRGVQVAGHGPSAVQQVPELERHRLARELHGGVIQEVLAAGLAIDLCLADAPAGSPMHASLEQAKQLTATTAKGP